MMATHTGGRIAMFHLFPGGGKYSKPLAWMDKWELIPS